MLFSVTVLVAIGLLFPLKYRDKIKKYAHEFGVDEELICAVINCESSFNPLAVSRKGARGLMQLMPSTAKWCAQKLGVEYSEEMLFSPDFNILIGSYYLSYLIGKFGNEYYAVCAYNAGEGNVIKWLNENREDIPFEETKGYVPRVFANKSVYRRILT